MCRSDIFVLIPGCFSWFALFEVKLAGGSTLSHTAGHDNQIAEAARRWLPPDNRARIEVFEVFGIRLAFHVRQAPSRRSCRCGDGSGRFG
jgi:hypothetical protein